MAYRSLCYRQDRRDANGKIDIFDFALTEDEIASISALDTGEQRGVDSDITGH